MAEAPTIHVDIVSAEGELFSGPAAVVFAPASQGDLGIHPRHAPLLTLLKAGEVRVRTPEDRKSTRLNSSHSQISYAVFCLKKKKRLTPDGDVPTAAHDRRRLTLPSSSRRPPRIRRAGGQLHRCI